MIYRVSPILVPSVWPNVESAIWRAMKRCKDDTLQSLKQECETGAAQLWLATINDTFQAGVIVTEIQFSVTRKVLEIRYLAGVHLLSWIDAQPSLAAWAKSHGCASMRMRGRKGWTRLLPKYGWKPTNYEMEHPIDV